jgi:predicted regulator of Ras-like GTPase activity (Roadblock/LC7/MglB family)
MPAELDSEAMGVWSLGIFLNTQNSVKKLGHNHVHQVVSRTPSGYLIIADFGGGILVTLSEGSETERLIPLMRNITKLVAA